MSCHGVSQRSELYATASYGARTDRKHVQKNIILRPCLGPAPCLLLAFPFKVPDVAPPPAPASKMLKLALALAALPGTPAASLCASVPAAVLLRKSTSLLLSQLAPNVNTCSHSITAGLTQGETPEGVRWYSSSAVRIEPNTAWHRRIHEKDTPPVFSLGMPLVVPVQQRKVRYLVPHTPRHTRPTSTHAQQNSTTKVEKHAKLSST